MLIGAKAAQQFLDKAMAWRGWGGYFDIEAKAKYVNPLAIKLFGYRCLEQTIDQQFSQMPCPVSECAETFSQQAREVFSSRKIMRKFDIFCHKKEEWRVHSVKVIPVFNTQKACIGFATHGVEIVYKDLFELAALLGNYGINKKSKLSLEANSFIIENNQGTLIPLNLEEQEVLCWILRMKKNRQLQLLLQKKPEEITQLIDSLKEKFKASCKAELIDKAIDLGYFYRIPQTVFTKQMSIILRENI